MGAAVALLAATIASPGCKPTGEPPEITPLEAYKIRARVWAKKNYANPWMPTDLVLAWGPLLEKQSTQGVFVSQDARMYFFLTPHDGPDEHWIAKHSANTHMVATNTTMRKTLAKIKPGQILYIEGALVNLTTPEGQTWKSSLSREDRGKGACEILLPNKIQQIQ
jgi:hypothetical protein